ncbi:MAG: response regulator transcription factor [Chloroflexota bacterium]|nr:response regulator transcription factor [Chloroflexota bacterium]
MKEGSTNKEIARMRGVSEQAVKRQVSILLKRFGVENRTELVHVVYESELHARAPSRDDAPSGGSGNSRTCG